MVRQEGRASYHASPGRDRANGHFSSTFVLKLKLSSMRAWTLSRNHELIRLKCCKQSQPATVLSIVMEWLGTWVLMVSEAAVGEIENEGGGMSKVEEISAKAFPSSSDAATLQP